MISQDELRVLLIGRDRQIFDPLTAQLLAAGYAAGIAETTATVWRAVMQDSPFAIVVDASDGDSAWAWTLCCDLGENVDYLVIMLIQGNALRAQLKGLSYGADQCLAVLPGYGDLLVKYLNRQRVRLNHREGQIQNESVALESTLEADPANRRTFRNGNMISLTGREYAVLEALLRQPGQTMPTRDLCQAVWDSKEYSSSRALLKQHIAHIRHKIEPDPKRPIHLETVRGIGYCLHLSGRLADPSDEGLDSEPSC